MLTALRHLATIPSRLIIAALMRGAETIDQRLCEPWVQLSEED